MRTLIPPTLSTLLDEPAYRKYYTRKPKLPANISSGEPWQVVVRLHNGNPDVPSFRWGRKNFGTYADAFEFMKVNLRKDTVMDLSIVSRRHFFAPSRAIVLTALWDPRLAWCYRCRRPTWFKDYTYSTHHNLRNAPAITDDEARRCYYCGIRRVAMPQVLRYEGQDTED